MTISIIIPVYNEAENIGKLISYLKQYKESTVVEIIVVDAGSIDDTVMIAKNAGAATLISPKKGRAAQMNYGASIAKGSVLYFYGTLAVIGFLGYWFSKEELFLFNTTSLSFVMYCKRPSEEEVQEFLAENAVEDDA